MSVRRRAQQIRCAATKASRELTLPIFFVHFVCVCVPSVILFVRIDAIRLFDGKCTYSYVAWALCARYHAHEEEIQEKKKWQHTELYKT